MTDVKTKYFQTPKQYLEYIKIHGPIVGIMRGNTFQHYTLDGTLISWGFTNSELSSYIVDDLRRKREVENG